MKQPVNIHATEPRLRAYVIQKHKKRIEGEALVFGGKLRVCGNVGRCCFGQVERQIRVPNFAAPDPFGKLN